MRGFFDSSPSAPPWAAPFGQRRQLPSILVHLLNQSPGALYGTSHPISGPSSSRSATDLQSFYGNIIFKYYVWGVIYRLAKGRLWGGEKDGAQRDLYLPNGSGWQPGFEPTGGLHICRPEDGEVWLQLGGYISSFQRWRANKSNSISSGYIVITD